MPQDLSAKLFSELRTPFTGEMLFDHLTDLTYFIKNRSGAYVVVNQSLVDRCVLQTKADILGKTANEVYPHPLGEVYRQQDDVLLLTGKPLLHRLELHIYPSGTQGWCLTHKVPLKNSQQEVIGLVGISKDLHAPSDKSEDYTPIAQTIQYIQAHFDGPLKIANLAQRSGLSPYQFEQRIHRIFELTVGQFIQKVRMDAAVRRLEDTQDAIAKIALDCGYSGQSTFSRQFKQVVGLSPGQYRQLKRLNDHSDHPSEG